MPYPILSKAEARTYLLATEDTAASAVPPARWSDDGTEQDWEALGMDIAAKLLTLLAKHEGEGKIRGGDFEAEAAPVVHQTLPSHPALADPEFWIWLAVSHCEEVIRRRYFPNLNPQNFGVGGAGENLLYRLWLRAEIAFDPAANDRYALARFGDIDFWRSHIFRQGYGDVRTFARALLEFQFPAQTGRKSRLTIFQIRDLAKHLKRARSNLMFEIMSEERAALFIQSEWDRIAQPRM